MIRGAARRFALFFFGLGGGSVAVGALIGVSTGSGAARGAAIGLYAVGSLCTLMGASVVIRNSLQLQTSVRRSTNVAETLVVDRELAGVLVLLGILLVAVGIALDPGARLV